MLYVGIDAASEKHDVTIINSNGDILTPNFTIENSRVGFKKLHTEIKFHTESLQVCIGMEETGIYNNNIADYFFNLGYMVFCTNAILVKNFIKSKTVRLTKTDSLDSYYISLFNLINYDSLIPYTPKVYITNELKSLSRLRFDKTNQLSKYKSEFKRLLMISFPEFVKRFDPLSKWVFTLLTKYTSKEAISRAHVNSLAKVIRSHGNRLETAASLKLLAKVSIGNSNSVNSLMLENVMSDIIHFKAQIKVIDESITEHLQDYKHILSVPGIGPVTGSLIIGEIGDVTRFKNKFSLLAFAGCDPTIYESGKFKSKRSKISKRGSKYLRSALYTSTRVACVGKNKSNKFRTKYDKKMKQGKHHNSAIFNVAKNMLFTIYSMLKTGEYYNDSE